MTIDKKTKIIDFKRQLWPQPPKDSEPYFCHINTLIFYDRDLNEVWRQDIPESLIKWDFNKVGDRKIQNVYSMSVEWVDEHWGWILKFKVSHEVADELWKHLLNEMGIEDKEANIDGERQIITK